MNLYDKRWCTHVINGILWGLGCATFLIGFIWALGGYHFHIAAPSFGKGVVHLCEYAVTFLIVGATEESMFRGYFHHQLNRVFGFWVASIVTSILFGAIHLPGGTPLWGAVEAGIAGFVFCMMLWRTGSMAFPIGFHAAWDWTQSALFGVNDSGHAAAGALLRVETTGPYWITGGSDGPEASALCFLLFVVITFLLLRKPKKILGY
nr:CPBP family intramembrane glutamic endopeptidase [Saccharibacter sp. 17.LH.SD]